jgi:hypothetical protein
MRSAVLLATLAALAAGQKQNDIPSDWTVTFYAKGTKPIELPTLETFDVIPNAVRADGEMYGKAKWSMQWVQDGAPANVTAVRSFWTAPQTAGCQYTVPGTTDCLVPYAKAFQDPVTLAEGELQFGSASADGEYSLYWLMVCFDSECVHRKQYWPDEVAKLDGSRIKTNYKNPSKAACSKFKPSTGVIDLGDPDPGMHAVTFNLTCTRTEAYNFQFPGLGAGRLSELSAGSGSFQGTIVGGKGSEFREFSTNSYNGQYKLTQFEVFDLVGAAKSLLPEFDVAVQIKNGVSPPARPVYKWPTASGFSIRPTNIDTAPEGFPEEGKPITFEMNIETTGQDQVFQAVAFFKGEDRSGESWPDFEVPLLNQGRGRWQGTVMVDKRFPPGDWNLAGVEVDSGSGKQVWGTPHEYPPSAPKAPPMSSSPTLRPSVLLWAGASLLWCGLLW